MTGESHLITKNTVQHCLKKQKEIESEGGKNKSSKNDVPSPVIMSGTKVLTGQGKMLMLVVGDSSCNGKIRKALNQEEDFQATPLQMKL